MDFPELLNELKTLNLPLSDFAITSSGVLAVRKIREANDLDIIVLPYLWLELSRKYKVKTENDFKTIYIGNIQVLGEGSWFTDPEFESVEEQIRNADIIDEIRYVKIEIVRKIKQKRNKEKDISDISLIDNYIG